MIRRLGLALTLGLAGCAVMPGAPSSTAIGAAAGRYVGTLPCTDCAGIRTDLVLQAPTSGSVGTYDMRETWVGARQPGVGKRHGGQWTLQADAAGEVLRVVATGLPPGERYFVRVGDQVLRLLDAQRRELPAQWPRSLVRVPDDVDPQALVLTAGDNGSLVDAAVGGSLVVMLAANRSAGYRWQPLLGSDDVLVPSSARTYETSGEQPGAGGIEVFRFQVPRAGVQILRFEYRRPWERTQPSVQAVSFTLRVR